MNNETKVVVFEGRNIDNYRISRGGEITSVFGNTLTVGKTGKVSLTIEGKRRSVLVDDILNETYVAENINEVYYNHETKNASFIRVHEILKSQGVENNEFFLALHNVDLLNINPHNPTNNKEVRAAVIEECRVNPWYFFREVARIFNPGGGGTPFQLHQANLANIYLSLRNIDTYTVTPRMTYSTVSAVTLLTWMSMFSKDATISLNDMHINNAFLIFDKIETTVALLPTYMRKHAKGFTQENKGTGVSPTIQHSNGSSIVIKNSPTNATQASTIARGNNAAIQLFDNFEFINHGVYLLLEGAPTHANSKTEEGGHSFRMLTSTVSEEGEGEAIHSLINDSVRWSNIFYDYEIEEELGYTQMETRRVIVYIEFSAGELDKDGDWVEDMSRSLFHDKIKIDREIHLIRGTVVEKVEEEDKGVELVHEWYIGTDAANTAAGLYNSLDLSLYDGNVPEVVKNDMLLDGFDVDAETFAPEMVRAYIIRYITELVVSGMPVRAFDVRSNNEHDTYFATFGTHNPLIVESLFATEVSFSTSYASTLFKVLRLPSITVENIKSICEHERLSAKSFHIMMQLLKGHHVE